jgi:hypothetical protein
MLREKVGNELVNILAVRNRCHFPTYHLPTLPKNSILYKITFWYTGCASKTKHGMKRNLGYRY